MSRRAARVALLAAAAALIAGCASGTQAPASPPAPKAAPAVSAPRYNLAGYSTVFKQGYADACARPRRRNERSFKTEPDYRMGWQDGQSLCRR